MNMDVDRVRSNLANVEERIRRASSRVGRIDAPRLLVATKYVGAEDMGVLQAAGIRLVGENRAEELESKWQEWGGAFEFHFIGHLQSRKARQVLPCATLIHSVDSIKLVEELEKRAERPVNVLLEVNVSGENTKYGILPAHAEAFLQEASGFQKVRFVGFMTMAPFAQDPETARPVFRCLRQLRDRLAPGFAGRYVLSELSMGMSDDYEVAVEEGATIIRVGTALFSNAQGG